MTRAERDETRAMLIRRLGEDRTIQEETRDDIVRAVESVWTITGEQFSAYRLTLDVTPQMDATWRSIHDTQNELAGMYGNPPFSIATEFTIYRLTFIAN